MFYSLPKYAKFLFLSSRLFFSVMVNWFFFKFGFVDLLLRIANVRLAIIELKKMSVEENKKYRKVNNDCRLLVLYILFFFGPFIMLYFLIYVYFLSFTFGGNLYICLIIHPFRSICCIN